MSKSTICTAAGDCKSLANKEKGVMISTSNYAAELQEGSNLVVTIGEILLPE